MEELRYPIGKFEAPSEITKQAIDEWIRVIEEAPQKLRQAVDGLSEEQLETPYRPGGWTVRQVVHHLADANLNGYIRFKLALTEENPTIKPFDEERWAELADGKSGPVEVSLSLMDSLHQRWVRLLRAMSPADFDRSFVHPVNGEMKLSLALGFFAWHNRHHTAQITKLRERAGWNR